MMFAAVVGFASVGLSPPYATPTTSMMEIVRRETIYRNRNAVQTNPATSHNGRAAGQVNRRFYS
jgi:hypothetical protein